MPLLRQTLFLITIFSFATSCSSKEENKSQAENPVKVSVATVDESNMNEQLNYSGTIQAANTVQLGFSVPGRVDQVSAEEGLHVNQGQLLATIETTDYQNQLTIAGAGLDQAADNFKRANELHLKGSLTDRDFITAKVTLTQAEANKNLAVKRLSDSYLRAPFSGIVTAKLIERGTTVQPGAPAFTLMKTDFVYAQLSVPETDIGKLNIGTSATIVANSSEAIHGTVSIINPQADAASKTFTVKIRIPNTNGMLLQGMICNIKITTGKKLDAITIPVNAIIRDADDLTYVFVVNAQKKAVLKRIIVGDLAGSALVVTSGLTQGDQIVTAGQKNIKDGQQLTVN